EVFSLPAHAGPITALAFSNDRLWLASGSFDKTIKVWNLKSGNEVQSLTKHNAPIGALKFNKSSTLLFSSANTDVIVWDTKTWEAKQTFKRSTAAVTNIALTDDETSLALGEADGNSLVWKVGTHREHLVFKHNTTAVLALEFAANDSLIAIHANHEIEVWDPTTGDLRRAVSGDSNSEQLAFAVIASGASIFASTDGSRILKTNSVATGEGVQTFESHASSINSIAFSPDGRWFASANHDSSIRLWQVATGRELPRLRGHAGYATAVAFSPNSSLLASGSKSGEIKIWDVNNAQLLFGLQSRTNGVNNLAFDLTGNILAVVGMDQRVEVWDLEKKQARYFAGHSQEISSVVLGKDRLITGSRDKTIRIWDLNSGAAIRTLKSPGEVNGLALNSSGDVLAAANSDGTITCWDIVNGVSVRTLKDHTNEVLCVRFSADGNKLASASADRSVIVWDLQTGLKIHQLQGSIDAVTSVVFSQNSKWILSASYDGTILLWQAATGKLMATLISIPASDDWLVVTPDGLFDGSSDSWDRVVWRFDQSTFNVVPVEAFFNEFFYPGVLAEILADQNPKASEDIAQKDRRQPSVSLAATAGPNPRNITVDITLRASPPEKNHPQEGGARDLRLFRNGLLIRAWRGDLIQDTKATTIKATVPIIAGENKFVAYAFNDDNVKSTDANLIITGPASLQRKGTAYLLMIGVEHYENAEYNLRYSAADVAEMEMQLKSQQEIVGTYNPVVTIPLIDGDATKANILLALEHLSGRNTEVLPARAPAVLSRIKPAQPEDAVLVYFSGHGVADNNHFFLIPHDLGYMGQRSKLNETGFELILKHGISDDELETALQPLDADQLLLVIDACYSGQAVESTERRRGPMNTKGLAQLAYEKGMYVLTASQNMEVAFEAEAFKHSYLAYALLEEGLKAGAADDNGDKYIFLEEWFDYANRRVPQLRRSELKRKELVEDEADEQKVQRPRVFYTRDEGAKRFLVGRVPQKLEAQN
ncbi:MAG TPA: caspase family protein, partial [Pyrinomonadaceae bacterium]|nr:caspase family protein [Pyrinomonadaceae bacterium]